MGRSAQPYSTCPPRKVPRAPTSPLTRLLPSAFALFPLPLFPPSEQSPTICALFLAISFLLAGRARSLFLSFTLLSTLPHQPLHRVWRYPIPLYPLSPLSFPLHLHGRVSSELLAWNGAQPQRVPVVGVPAPGSSFGLKGCRPILTTVGATTFQLLRSLNRSLAYVYIQKKGLELVSSHPGPGKQSEVESSQEESSEVIGSGAKLHRVKQKDFGGMPIHRPHQDSLGANPVDMDCACPHNRQYQAPESVDPSICGAVTYCRVASHFVWPWKITGHTGRGT